MRSLKVGDSVFLCMIRIKTNCEKYNSFNHSCLLSRRDGGSMG